MQLIACCFIGLFCFIMTSHLLLTASILLVLEASISCAFIPQFTLQNIGNYRFIMLASSSLSSSQTNDPIPRPGDRPPPQGGDMAYTKANIDRQYAHYTQIRKVGVVDCVTDVYASSPKQPHVFWFAGKVARCTGTVSVEQAVNRQWNLLEEHVVRLRPVELGRSFGEVQFWTAPGDSELACDNNQVALQRVEKMNASNVTIQEVGCNLEVVTNKGVGFFVERAADGTILSDTSNDRDK